MNHRSYSFSRPVERRIEAAVCLWLLALVSAFAVTSRHWPMVGDVTFMHYVVFLMKHGMAPYRDIVDMNLPGSYLLEAAAMQLPGGDAIGWRLYDFALMLIASVSLIVILKRQGQMVGVLAAALFVLIHGQDGTIMAGERDFAASVLMLATAALFFSSLRRGKPLLRSSVLAFLCGVPLGLAVCVKPTLLPMLLCMLMWLAWSHRVQSLRTSTGSGLIVTGFLLPVAVMGIFLLREHAIEALLGEVHGLLIYHATIDQKSIGYLLGHSISPLLPLLVLWLSALYVLRETPSDPERVAILCFALCGLFSYVIQRKGFSYQRYPFLAFLLPLLFTDFARLLTLSSRRRLLGAAAVAVGVGLASQFTIRLTTFQRTAPTQPLLADLAVFGTSQDISGKIQCMDTIGSCIDNLYAGRIVQSTGFLYDCYLLGGQGAARDAWVTEDLRKRFWQQIDHSPPRLIVVTDSVCYQQAPSYDKYQRWPEFQHYLDANYTLKRQSDPPVPVRYWSRPTTPFGYRIYERKTKP